MIPALHLKSFVTGLLLGIVGAGGIAWFFAMESGSAVGSRYSKIVDTRNAPECPKCTSAITESKQASTDNQPDPISDASQRFESENNQQVAQPNIVSGEIDGQPVAVSDLHRTFVHEDGVPDPDSGHPADKHATFEAEPEDLSWSHNMEQAITQFLASHPKIGAFEIFSVACRSSTCELQVIGFDESTNAIWAQILYDLRQQPWSEFGETGSSSSTVDGRLAIITFLKRG